MKTNFWKTSDIKITKDREGFFDATHKHAGDLIVTGNFESRKECRQEAVRNLKELKEEYYSNQ